MKNGLKGTKYEKKKGKIWALMVKVEGIYICTRVSIFFWVQIECHLDALIHGLVVFQSSAGPLAFW